MIGTGIRQFRMALAIIFGRPFNTDNLRALVRDALSTVEELGYPDDDLQAFLHGPLADPAARQELQDFALQRTLRNLLRYSPYYQKRLASHDITPRSLSQHNLHQLPVISKSDLQTNQRDFLAINARPALSTRTTGTTGPPTEIWLSQYESELRSALMALSMVLNREFDPQGCLQINLSLRATALIQSYVTFCQLTGIRMQVLGIVPVEVSLKTLLSGDTLAPTMLATYPSYLAQLVAAARQQGLKPGDFRLRYIYIGGEIFSTSLARAAWETFGAEITEGYGSTETLPAAGALCREGHLHSDVSSAFFEVIQLQTDNHGEPAAPGELGTLVITPYYPYRVCMPLLRYDTRDVVRRLPDTSLHCELAHLPATSHIAGKADHLLWCEGEAVTTRALVEAIEALPSHPWPARFRAHVTANGLELQLPRQALDGLTAGDVLEHMHKAKLPVCTVQYVEPAQVRGLRRLRCDLLEGSFTENQ